MSAKVLLLYGSGPNVGAGILKKFASNGWKTAAVVRTLKEEYKNSADLVVQGDFADAASIQKIYGEVESKLGTPACVVYNAYSLESFSPDASKPFAASPDAFTRDLAINTVGCYAAASSAAAGFAKLSSGPKAFIYTGNGFPTSIVPEQTGLGGGKAASAYLMELASKALKDSHWYFADERLESGKPIMTNLSGEAHGEAYYALATGEQQAPWNYTFVKGKGYVKFPDTSDHGYTPIAELFKNIGQ